METGEGIGSDSRVRTAHVRSSIDVIQGRGDSEPLPTTTTSSRGGFICAIAPLRAYNDGRAVASANAEPPSRVRIKKREGSEGGGGPGHRARSLIEKNLRGGGVAGGGQAEGGRRGRALLQAFQECGHSGKLRTASPAHRNKFSLLSLAP